MDIPAAQAVADIDHDVSRLVPDDQRERVAMPPRLVLIGRARLERVTGPTVPLAPAPELDGIERGPLTTSAGSERRVVREDHRVN